MSYNFKFANKSKYTIKKFLINELQSIHIGIDYESSKIRNAFVNTANTVQVKTEFGEFKNVLLTKNEFEKLKSQYREQKQRKENLTQGNEWHLAATRGNSHKISRMMNLKFV